MGVRDRLRVARSLAQTLYCQTVPEQLPCGETSPILSCRGVEMRRQNVDAGCVLEGVALCKSLQLPHASRNQLAAGETRSMVRRLHARAVSRIANSPLQVGAQTYTRLLAFREI
jgi:hypothetical protein